MKININSLHVRNFLSVGNKWIIINYEKGLYKVSGENLDNNTRNGVGKCVDGDTEVEVTSSYLEEYSSTATVKQIVDFYEKYPEYKGSISVKTPYGFKKIEEAKQTDYSIPLKIITSENKSVICSKQHRFKINETDFKKAEDFKVNDEILTEDGLERIKEVTILNNEQPLYDFQVAEVEQYYTNGIVSHNSSIFVDGLMFGLFGKPVRKVNIETLVNKNNQKGCEIKIDFSVENKRYLIHRGIKPSFLKLYENYEEGKENTEIEDSAKKFTQKRIDSLLSANFNTFNHLLVMTSSYTTPFLELDTSKKRQVIEDLLGVSIFGEMAEKAKDLFLDHKNNLSVLSKEYELTKSNLESLILSNNNLLKKSNEFKSLKKKKLDDILHKLKTNLSDLNSVTDQIEVQKNNLVDADFDIKINVIRDKLLEIDVSLRTKKNKINDNSQVITSLKDKPICPICKTDTSSDHVATHLSDLMSENVVNNEDIDKLKDKKIKLQAKLEEINSKQQDNSDVQSLISKLENKLQILTIEKKELKSRAVEIKEETNNFEDLINEKDVISKTNLLLDLDNKMNISLEEKKYNEYIRKMLSNEGVKNYIISKILTFWNKKVNFYLSKLNAEFSLIFDDNLEATIKSRNTDPLTYHSFSGGEKARIDIAILLSIIDISKIQNSIDLNVMVVDEVLDGGLDDVGREEVVNLFKHMSVNDNKSIFIISHNTSLSNELFTKELLLQKKNGFTSLINE